MRICQPAAKELVGAYGISVTIKNVCRVPERNVCNSAGIIGDRRDGMHICMVLRCGGMSQPVTGGKLCITKAPCSRPKDSGGMGEWLKPAVLKTVSPERGSGVRIPLPPPGSGFFPV